MNTEKKEYASPSFEEIELDNEISLIMMSDPGGGDPGGGGGDPGGGDDW